MTLTLCVYTEFAPFVYEEAGAIVGSDITLLSRFAAHYQLGLQIIKQAHFDQLWHTPGRGECDIAAAGIAMLPERDLGEAGCWGIPYLTVQRSLLIRRQDAARLQRPTDFAGKKLVVTPASTAHVDALARYEPLGATIIPYVPSQQAVVHQLLTGEVDAFGEGDVSNCYLADHTLDEQGQPLLVLTDRHPLAQPEELRFAVRAHDPRLVACLNDWLHRALGAPAEELPSIFREGLTGSSGRQERSSRKIALSTPPILVDPNDFIGKAVNGYG